MERENFIQSEYSVINSDEISIDPDDQDFIDNFSWDTSSINDTEIIDYF